MFVMTLINESKWWRWLYNDTSCYVDDTVCYQITVYTSTLYIINISSIDIRIHLSSSPCTTMNLSIYIFI
jgi:hypothetical protein